jgi:hypothetical protein
MAAEPGTVTTARSVGIVEIHVISCGTEAGDVAFTPRSIANP